MSDGAIGEPMMTFDRFDKIDYSTFFSKRDLAMHVEKPKEIGQWGSFLK